MSRIKLALPSKEQFIFTTEIVTRISEINYGSHLGHDHLITLLHEVRLRFLQKYNFSEIDVAGSSIIVADLAINYRAEVVWGERLSVEIALYDPSRSGCDFFYLVKKSESGVEVARAKTGIVFFNYQEKKVARMPQAFAQLFSPPSVKSNEN